MKLQLRQDVHFCVANGETVFLDLRSSRYLALPVKARKAFDKAVAGEELNEQDLLTLAPLIQRNILAPIDNSAAQPFLSSIERASRTYQPKHTLTNPLLILKTVISHGRTAMRLNSTSLNNIITDIQCKKKNLRADNVDILELDRVVQAILLSKKLVPTQDKCLRASIAAIRQLIDHGIHCELVVGVKMNPFGAHAWVQRGPFVLNDTAESVAPYTPILVV